MNCVIPGSNIKVLNKAVEAMAKLSDEVYIECHEDLMTLSAIHMAKTSFAKFTFDPTFFLHYEKDALIPNITCKMYNRCLLTIFKRKMERKVETCKILLEHEADNIVFRIKYKSDVAMVHKFHLLDLEYLTLSYQVDDAQNKVDAKSALFTNVLSNFQYTDLQLNLEATKDSIKLRNYDVDNKIFKGIRSQINLQAGEFDDYQIHQEAGFMMPLKPFKSVASFADSLTSNLSLHFQTGGTPLIVTVKDPTYQVLFVISTNRTGNTCSQTTSNLSMRNNMATSTANRTVLTQADKDAMEGVNWDDFDMDIDPPNANPQKPSDDHQLDNVSNQPDFNPLNVSLNELEPRVVKVFGRCFEPTFRQSQVDLGSVLVMNSDTEDEGEDSL